MGAGRAGSVHSDHPERFRKWLFAAALLLASAVLASCGGASRQEGGTGTSVVRVGYFPNLAHAQAVIGLADGTFQRVLGPGVKLESRIFNAGPSLIQALLAGEIDIGYVGPVPAVTGYVRSDGRALRIIAGAASGGAVLAVRPQAGIGSLKDLQGKKVAVPQLGNTQDLSLRHFLRQNGLEAAERGGSVTVIPMANPDILAFFRKGDIDAAWVPEPWGARLKKEAGAQILVDERTLWTGGRFATAVVVARTDFLAKNSSLVRKWLEAHVSLTDRLRRQPEQALPILNAEIARLTGKALREDILADAVTRLEFTYDPLQETVLAYADWLYQEGYLGGKKPDLAGLFALDLLVSLNKDEGR